MQKVNNCISEQCVRRNVTRVNGTLKLKNVIKDVNVHHALTPNCATAKRETTVAESWIPFQPNQKENSWAKAV